MFACYLISFACLLLLPTCSSNCLQACMLAGDWLAGWFTFISDKVGSWHVSKKWWLQVDTLCLVPFKKSLVTVRGCWFCCKAYLNQLKESKSPKSKCRRCYMTENRFKHIAYGFISYFKGTLAVSQGPAFFTRTIVIKFVDWLNLLYRNVSCYVGIVSKTHRWLFAPSWTFTVQSDFYLARDFFFLQR